MIYTELTRKAMKIAFDAHKNQVDKSGVPYIFHPIHLAEQMSGEETTVVALLHDVIEDTEITLDDLREEGFSESILTAIGAMTHDKAVPYMDYVSNIKTNRIASTVKLADLRHNSDLSRFGEIDEKAKSRLEQYRKAIKLLTE